MRCLSAKYVQVHLRPGRNPLSIQSKPLQILRVHYRYSPPPCQFQIQVFSKMWSHILVRNTAAKVMLTGIAFPCLGPLSLLITEPYEAPQSFVRLCPFSISIHDALHETILFVRNRQLFSIREYMQSVI